MRDYNPLPSELHGMLFTSAFQGFIGTADAGKDTVSTFVVMDESYLSQLFIACKDHVFSDYLDVSLVDLDGVLGDPGAYRSDLLFNWYVCADRQEQAVVQLPELVHVPAGLYLRVNYHSTGASPVQFTINACLNVGTFPTSS